MLQDLSPTLLSLPLSNGHPIKEFNNCTDFDFSRFGRKLLSQVEKKMLKQKNHIFSRISSFKDCLTSCFLILKDIIKSIVEKMLGGRLAADRWRYFRPHPKFSGLR